MKSFISTSFLFFSLSVGICQAPESDHLLVYNAEALYKPQQDLDKAVSLKYSFKTVRIFYYLTSTIYIKN